MKYKIGRASDKYYAAVESNEGDRSWYFRKDGGIHYSTGGFTQGYWDTPEKLVEDLGRGRCINPDEFTFRKFKVGDAVKVSKLLGDEVGVVLEFLGNGKLRTKWIWHNQPESTAFITIYQEDQLVKLVPEE